MIKYARVSYLKRFYHDNKKDSLTTMHKTNDLYLNWFGCDKVVALELGTEQASKI